MMFLWSHSKLVENLASAILDKSQSFSLLEDGLLAPLGEWSEWSACLREGVTCGFRWGKQTRTRIGGPSGRTPEEKAASLCPSHSETQRCRMKKKCPTGEEKGGRLEVQTIHI